MLQCDNDGEIEYEFPCFNQVETLDGLWEKGDPRYTNGVYGGVRLRSPAPTQYILPPIYIRMQVYIGKSMLQRMYEYVPSSVIDFICTVYH